jgi:hypothetical protein
VENRFHSLPFKRNLQRYTVVPEQHGWLCTYPGAEGDAESGLRALADIASATAAATSAAGAIAAAVAGACAARESTQNAPMLAKVPKIPPKYQK